MHGTTNVKFVPLRPEYLSKHSILEHRQLILLPRCERDQISHQYKRRGILLDISVIYRLMLVFEMMANIPMCTLATTAVTTTAYATTISNNNNNNNNKLHNINFDKYKMFIFILSRFRRIVPYVGN